MTPYACTFHPVMHGTLEVVAPSEKKKGPPSGGPEGGALRTERPRRRLPFGGAAGGAPVPVTPGACLGLPRRPPGRGSRAWGSVAAAADELEILEHHLELVSLLAGGLVLPLVELEAPLDKEGQSPGAILGDHPALLALSLDARRTPSPRGSGRSRPSRTGLAASP